MTPLQKKTLFDLLSLPTAPYRERAVLTFCKEFLHANSVPFFVDTVGNIVIGAKNRSDYTKALAQKNPQPARLLIAHTDHPGFHGVKWMSSKKLLVKWYGGSPVKHLKGAKVWVSDQRSHKKFEGRIMSAKLASHKHSIDKAVIAIDSKQFHQLKAHELFGAFAFRAPVFEKNKILYTGGADDIVGCFSILQTAATLWKKRDASRKNFFALLSRAEEVGFIGAIGHFEYDLPKKRARELCVLSLETSRTLPAALIGEGPVIRLGDRSSVFDSTSTVALTQCAQQSLKKFQRRIMDGGSCEATAAIRYGIRSVGISVPLGNYHNISYQGGPDSSGSMGPAPEFVHLDDVDGQMKLCLAFAKKDITNKNQIFKDHILHFKKSLKAATPLLKSESSSE